ncbi:T9SS type A sorting domain-containing protein, partial [candidate division KSB1 bacterium]
EVDNQDWEIYGYGLLIWHIDENVILSNFESNSINTDPLHRGVALEEADGAVDIGLPREDIFPGFFTPEFGQLFDAFFADTLELEDSTYIGNSSFTPYTNPNSNSNLGGKSHIYITDISNSGNIMSFNLDNEHLVEGFPYYIKNAENIFLTSSPNGEIMAVDTAVNEIHMWDNNGAPLYDYSYQQEIPDINNIPTTEEIFVYTPFNGSIGTIPAIIDENNDGEYEFLIGDKEGNFAVFRIQINEIDIPKLIKSFKLDPPGHPKLMGFVEGGEYKFVYVTANKKLVSFNIDGEILWEFPNWEYPNPGLVIDFAFNWISAGTPAAIFTRSDGPVYRLQENILRNSYNTELEGKVQKVICADLDMDGTDETILDTDSKLIILSGGYMSPQQETDFLDMDFDDISAGDINNDGEPEIIAYKGNILYVFNGNGTLFDNFPFKMINFRGYGNFSGTPAVADINEDGYHEIIVGTDYGEVLTLDRRANVLHDYSFSASGKIMEILVHNYGTNETAITALSSDNYIYSWRLGTDFSTENVSWSGRYNGGLNSSHFSSSRPHSPKQYTALMPKERVYNYPNPNEEDFTIIRYYLTDEASVRIKILDLTGNLVKEMLGPGLANTDNEIKWELSGIPSGIYLAVVEARSGDRKEYKTIKIAVIK